MKYIKLYFQCVLILIGIVLSLSWPTMIGVLFTMSSSAIGLLIFGNAVFLVTPLWIVLTEYYLQ